MADHDPDEGLTARERTRRALHRAVDTICAAWPRVLEDADARGYPAGIDYNVRRATGENTSVEAAALRPSRAVAWLAELHDTITTLCGRLRWRKENVDQQMAFMPGMLHRSVETLCNDWPTKAEHTTRSVIRLANTADYWWPPQLQAGDNDGGVTVGTGRHTDDAEICVYCQVQAHAGDRRAIKNQAGEIEGYVHRSPCWYTVMTARGQHPRQKENT